MLDRALPALQRKGTPLGRHGLLGAWLAERVQPGFSSLLALLAKLLPVGHKLHQMRVAGTLVIKTNLTTSHTLRRLDSVMLPFLSPLMFNWHAWPFKRNRAKSGS